MERGRWSWKGCIAGTVMAIVIAGPLLSPTVAKGQGFELGGDPAEIQETIGTAAIIFAEGEAVNPSARSEDRARYQWYMVQDSTLGVVFTEPSGIHATRNRLYNGDIDAVALRPITAVELRSATFTAWREFSGVIAVTSIEHREPGDEFNFDPTWRDIEEPANTHYISITWVHRVLYDDESITVADLEPVLEVASRFSEDITRQDLDPGSEERTTTVSAE